MENLIETIRAAAGPDATDEVRTAGAQACRTLLTALEAKDGEPLASSPSAPESALVAPSVPAPSPHAAVHAIASVLRGMTPDQLLDLAISRLRAALPAGADVPRSQAVNFHLVPLKR
jgi:hypothetical protein